MNIVRKIHAVADRRPPRRAGMTLVELLVVIGIIAILVGLLLPAVNAVVESSRRSNCLQNQKQIALAAAQYAAANRQLPGWRNEVITAVGPAYPSWPVLVLPHVDQQAVFDRWMSGAFFTPQGVPWGMGTGSPLPSGTVGPMLSVFVCPSARRQGTIPNSPSVHYAGNAGTGYVKEPATGTATDYRVWVGDGVMVDTAPRIKKPLPFPQTKVGNPNAMVDDPFWCELATSTQRQELAAAGISGPIIRNSVTPDSINANDGLTNTLLFSERSGVYVSYETDDTAYVRPPFWDGRYQTNPSDPNSPKMPWGHGLFDLQGQNGWEMTYRNLPLPVTPTGQLTYIVLPVPVFGFGDVGAGDPAIINYTPTLIRAGAFPSSRHPGGAVAAFCDGRTLFLADSLAPHVYAQLITSSQNNSSRATGFLNTAPANKRPYILDEKDYQ